MEKTRYRTATEQQEIANIAPLRSRHLGDGTWNAVQAGERYRSEHRFRSYVQSIVAHVMQDHGPVDPEKADRDAHDIAISVGAMLLETMYREDGELAALRAERDAYRKLAEETISLRPPQIIASAKP